MITERETERAVTRMGRSSIDAAEAEALLAPTGADLSGRRRHVGPAVRDTWAIRGYFPPNALRASSSSRRLNGFGGASPCRHAYQLIR